MIQVVEYFFKTFEGALAFMKKYGGVIARDDGNEDGGWKVIHNDFDRQEVSHVVH